MGLLGGTEDIGTLLGAGAGRAGLLSRLSDFWEQLKNPPQGVVPRDKSAGEAFHAVANPDAVLNSPVSQAGSGFAPIGMAGVMTYHGTPHKFDNYDLSKIGTGEGAQSYGHGIYFAENPAVSKVYQNTLGKTEITVDGKAISPSSFEIGDPRRGAAQWVDYAKFSGSTDPIKDGMLYAQQAKSYARKDQEIAQLKEWADKQGKVTRGALYKQDLPDEVLPRMLQWDKPLSEQPANVRQALITLGEKLGDSKLRTGGGSLGLLESRLGSRAAAAKALADSGIPGLSYLDAGSRGAGKGTMNHVVWDQELLNRMRPQVVE